jgi:3-methyl-2-oxobutanoate hydroxymethyltransferase
MNKGGTIPDLVKKKDRGEKIVALTCYDYQMARALDETGVDLILVGDSLGMTILGYKDTISVTLNDVLYHTKAVARGITYPVLISDMPFLSYSVSLDEAVRNAGRLVQEGGAQGVKIEGGKGRKEIIRRLVQADIPVLGHVGLTPQSLYRLGRYRVCGRESEEASRIKDDALAVQDAGAFSVVLECIPYDLAQEITSLLNIPTIGIGAGPHCNGQILVINDLLGFFEYKTRPPKHVKAYVNLREVIQNAVSAYAKDIRVGAFPGKEER